MKLFTTVLTSIPLCSSVGVFVGNERAAGSSWGYDEQGDDWGDSAETCNGNRQSPIDIPKDYSSAEFQPFQLTNFDDEQNWTLFNNGHSVQMTASNLNMKLNGGALPGEYILAQFHFHWGSAEHAGSEHTLEGKQYFSEVHLVHFKAEYETIGNSVNKGDGLAVLGFFIEEDPNAEDTPLDNFFRNLVGEAVQNPSETSTVQFSMTDILPSTLDNFYRYLGSLTTPTCNEAVVWTNFKESLKISTKTREFMTQFAKDKHGEDLVKNYRNVQPLNGREVTFFSSQVDRLNLIEYHFERIVEAIPDRPWSDRYEQRLNKQLKKAESAFTGVNCYKENGFGSDDSADDIQVFDESDFCKLNGQVNAALNSWARNNACEGRGKVYRQIIRAARKVRNLFDRKMSC